MRSITTETMFMSEINIGEISESPMPYGLGTSTPFWMTTRNKINTFFTPHLVRRIDLSYWGYHLILDCGGCDKSSITSPDIIRKFSETLVERIKMVPYGDPQIIHFGHNSPHLTGWTLLQFIETSNILAHFCDMSGEGYIDIFSCEEYDVGVAVDAVKEFFSPDSIKQTYLTRQA